MPLEHCNADGVSAICLDGGGYLGLATAAFLAEAERHGELRISDRFGLFCGTSTGGLIALALACGKSGAEIVELYKSLGPAVFGSYSRPMRAYRQLRGLAIAKYSNRSLRKALYDVFADRTLGDLFEQGRRVLIPAYCLTTGQPRVFKTDHAEGLTAHSKYKVVDVALATSAAPTYFPVVTIDSPSTGAPERFIDGGVCANNPGLLAYTECVGYLKSPPGKVRVLSISTPQNSLAEQPTKQSSNRGIAGWATKLPDLLIQPSMTLVHSALRQIAAPNSYLRIELESRPGLALDNASSEATAALIAIGSSSASSAQNRASLQPFLDGETHAQPAELL